MVNRLVIFLSINNAALKVEKFTAILKEILQRNF